MLDWLFLAPWLYLAESPHGGGAALAVLLALPIIGNMDVFRPAWAWCYPAFLLMVAAAWLADRAWEWRHRHRHGGGNTADGA